MASSCGCTHSVIAARSVPIAAPLSDLFAMEARDYRGAPRPRECAPEVSKNMKVTAHHGDTEGTEKTESFCILHFRLRAQCKCQVKNAKCKMRVGVCSVLSVSPW